VPPAPISFFISTQYCLISSSVDTRLLVIITP